VDLKRGGEEALGVVAVHSRRKRDFGAFHPLDRVGKLHL
jgi:hypothetical protein